MQSTSSLIVTLFSLLSSLPLILALPTATTITTPKIHEIDTRYNSTRAIFPLPRFDKTGKIQSRNPFNPKSNACRISMYRDLYNQIHCDTGESHRSLIFTFLHISIPQLLRPSHSTPPSSSPRPITNPHPRPAECHNDYFLVEEVVVADNNSNERYATFPGLPANGQWRFQALDGHRGFQVFLKYQSVQDWYGFREAYLHLEGHKAGDDRG
ncbi:hypothetical protein DL98DRAFT_595327 [Cadophora sp. DSE1049]|nr:hypothetical protein DL98DRAFT_595327 [Cadophora sp. DSE1049]